MIRDPITVLLILAMIGAAIATCMIVRAQPNLEAYDIFRHDWSGKR